MRSERVLVNSEKGEGGPEPQDAQGGRSGLEGEVELGRGGGPPPLADGGRRQNAFYQTMLHTHPHPSPHTSFSSLSHPAVGSWPLHVYISSLRGLYKTRNIVENQRGPQPMETISCTQIGGHYI